MIVHWLTDCCIILIWCGNFHSMQCIYHKLQLLSSSELYPLTLYLPDQIKMQKAGTVTLMLHYACWVLIHAHLFYTSQTCWTLVLWLCSKGTPFQLFYCFCLLVPELSSPIFKEYNRALIQERDRDMNTDRSYDNDYNLFSCLSRLVIAVCIFQGRK